MEIGAFSVSLAVKDIEASRDFYHKLGFKDAGGDIEGAGSSKRPLNSLQVLPNIKKQ